MIKQTRIQESLKRGLLWRYRSATESRNELSTRLQSPSSSLRAPTFSASNLIEGERWWAAKAGGNRGKILEIVWDVGNEVARHPGDRKKVNDRRSNRDPAFGLRRGTTSFPSPAAVSLSLAPSIRPDPARE